MSRILVVDDNPVDRCLMQRLLERSLEWKTEVACDGREALDQLTHSQVDLVITDLQMPHVDGLELVRRVRCSATPVPVLLVTALGSETMALEALRAGAANFTHKSRLNADLVATARSVLDWSTKLKALSHGPTEQQNQIAFVLDNDVARIPRAIECFCDQLPEWARSDELRISMALDEALTNAICHGNLEVCSTLKEACEDSVYEKAVVGRRDCEPFCQRRVHVQGEFSDNQILFQIRDEGAGFNPHSLHDPREPENIMKAGGRGLLLIRTFMDEVSHNACGNEITLIKRRQPCPCDEARH